MTTAIIGGGASGMVAAITASEYGRAVLFERQPRVGKKLLATGNGRCNLTNTGTGSSRYHGEAPSFAVPALEAFPVPATLDFFRSIGLITVTEPDGRVYPFTNRAESVLDVLRLSLNERGVIVKTGVEIESIAPGFTVTANTGEKLQCDKVIVAAGGAANARCGGCHAGYELLKSVGHTVTELHPSLVPVKSDKAFTKQLKGIRTDADVSILRGGKTIARSRGELQFTEYGLSGPVIFDVSRAVTAGGGDKAHIDFMPLMSFKELHSFLTKRCDNRTLTAENLLTGILHNKLGRVLCTKTRIPFTTPAAEIDREQLRRLVGNIKNCVLSVTGDLGLENAQVTAGGVRTSEFNPSTLESLIVPGLFACGEVLDIDGDCGGYNLQWAWSSGFTAGKKL